jgi:hypothetical protein
MHHAVNHKKGEYVRGNAHVNTAESVHALLKRGIIGTFHHAQRQGKRQRDNKVAVSPSRPMICWLSPSSEGKFFFATRNVIE